MQYRLFLRIAESDTKKNSPKTSMSIFDQQDTHTRILQLQLFIT